MKHILRSKRHTCTRRGDLVRRRGRYIPRRGDEWQGTDGVAPPDHHQIVQGDGLSVMRIGVRRSEAELEMLRGRRLQADIETVAACGAGIHRITEPAIG